jgi:hypothetical protein
MMKQMNQTGMGPMMMGQGMIMPCIIIGPMMMGNQTDGYDAVYDGNGSNEPNCYDGSNDGNATWNTEQIKINFFFI